MPVRRRGDCVDVVEALYALELDDDAWLGHIARAAAEGLGVRNLGAYAITYDASDIRDCQFNGFAATADVDPAIAQAMSHDFPLFYRRRPALVESIFRRVSYAASRELAAPAVLETLHQVLGRFGVDDVVGVNGVNVDGRGAHVGLLVPRRASTYDRDLFARVSVHLAAASRLRRRLSAASSASSAIEAADAVIDPHGRIVHAARGAKLRSARDALSAAARRLERLRGPIRKRDPEQAARQWKALVDGRWSLVDEFEADGKRFLLAQSNEAPAANVAFLSERERQVVALAALGHANKMIAYELGIAISTVGVLLGRAARKFGAKKRAALIEAYGVAIGRRGAAE